jgi:hypothetical protein
MLNSCRQHQCLATLFLGLYALPVYSTPLDQANSTSAIHSQQTQKPSAELNNPLLDQYRSITRQTDALTIYNRHLQDMLKSQTEEKTSLVQQLKDIEVTKKEIVPLILHMLDSLEQFVQMDLPFLAEERQQRLKLLKDMVVKADISDAEKFRRIMEAFQVENEYGNTIEAYKGNLVLNGVNSSVDFLRLGRVALYYQRLDGSETGFWNKEKRSWQTLASDYRGAIHDGLRIARKETAPDLLTLPVPAPEAAQ